MKKYLFLILLFISLGSFSQEAIKLSCKVVYTTVKNGGDISYHKTDSTMSTTIILEIDSTSGKALIWSVDKDGNKDKAGEYILSHFKYNEEDKVMTFLSLKNSLDRHTTFKLSESDFILEYKSLKGVKWEVRYPISSRGMIQNKKPNKKPISAPVPGE